MKIETGTQAAEDIKNALWRAVDDLKSHLYRSNLSLENRFDFYGTDTDKLNAQLKRWEALLNPMLAAPVKKSHWDNDPDYPVSDWTEEVVCDYTRLGYMAWVESMKEMDAEKKYTVFLLYPEYLTGDIFVESASADDGFQAAEKVQQMAMESNIGLLSTTIDASDFRVVAVIAGDHNLELDATCFETGSK